MSTFDCSARSVNHRIWFIPGPALFIILISWFAGCVEAPPGKGAADIRGPVLCGEAECGGDEFCYSERPHNCSGTMDGGTSALPRTFRCLAIPAGCDPSDLCDCTELPAGECEPARREVYEYCY